MSSGDLLDLRNFCKNKGLAAWKYLVFEQKWVALPGESTGVKRCLFCWSSSLWDCIEGKADHYWHAFPRLWANADRWAVKKGARCTNNTLICLRCNDEIAACVMELWLLVTVTCNQGKDLLRPVDSEVCSLPTWASKCTHISHFGVILSWSVSPEWWKSWPVQGKIHLFWSW